MPRRRGRSRSSACARLPPATCSASPNYATGWPAVTRRAAVPGLGCQPGYAVPGHAARRRLISHTRCGTGATTCPARFRSASSSRSRCPTGATARRSPTSLLADLYGDQVDAGGCSARPATSGTAETWWLPSGRAFYSPGRTTTPRPSSTTPGGTSSCRTGFRDPFGRSPTSTLRPLRPAGGADPRPARQPGHGRRARPGRPRSPPTATTTGCWRRGWSATRTATGLRWPSTPSGGWRHRGDGQAGGTTRRHARRLRPGPAARPVVDAYFADPFAHGAELLGQATTRMLYDLDAYRRTAGSRSRAWRGSALARETHVSDLAARPARRGSSARFSYSDGFGREIQHKGQAAPGRSAEDGPDVEQRWIGSGWTVFNNKGQPVRTYEPFFTAIARVRVRPCRRRQLGAFLRPARTGRGHAAPGRTATPRPSSTPGTRTPGTQLTRCCSTRADDPDVRGYAGRYLTALGDTAGRLGDLVCTPHRRRLGAAAQRAAEQTVTHAGTPAGAGSTRSAAPSSRSHITASAETGG